MQNPTVTDALKVSEVDEAAKAHPAIDVATHAAEEKQPQQILELGEISDLLGDAFEKASELNSQADLDDWDKDFAGDDLESGPDQAKWDAAIANNSTNPETHDTADPVTASHAEMLAQLSAAFGEGFDPAEDLGPIEDEDLADGAEESLVAASTPGLAPATPHATSPQFDEATLNALIEAAQLKLASDAQEATLKVNGSGEQSQEQRTEVGIVRGLSMLGGAGLAGLANVLKSGGQAITNKISTHRYAEFSGEVGTLTNTMDTSLNTFAANGYLEGLNGLTGDSRADFAREFMANPRNKQALEDTLEAMGKLSTKARAAVEAGQAANISEAQIENDVIRKINDVREKHKDLMDSLTDHKGNTLSDRMGEMLEQLMKLIEKFFDRVKTTLGIGPRPSM